MKDSLVVILMLGLASCAPKPEKALTENTVSISSAERKEELRLACLNEAEWPVKHKESLYYGRYASYKLQEQLRLSDEVRQMKSLCRQMDNLTTAKAKKIAPEKLASACASQIEGKKQKNDAAWDRHASRIQQICESMTGQKL